ncbi:CapA family protein [Candidatus Amarolinea aalborgensis]|uniref:CapA family protein n=1 Tax=Candidatus Amarolinea aalborgensis TaxID=2249329 RepID=UPI003BF9416C
MKPLHTKLLLALGVSALIALGACSQPSPSPAAPTAAASPTTDAAPATAAAPPTAAPTNTTPTATPTSTPIPPKTLALDLSAPAALRTEIVAWASAQGVILITDTATATLTIGPRAGDNAVLLAEQVYAAADWFATLRSGIASASLQGLWQGQPTDDGLQVLLVTEETARALTGLWGPPGPTVAVVTAEDLLTRLWKEKTALAIAPFDALMPQMAALPVDGLNILARDLPLAQYPLAVRTWISGDAGLAQALARALPMQAPLTNRHTDHITSLIMTGVTAMARNTAYAIEQRGDPAFPARKIADVLSAADITHISNEIPFYTGCEARPIKDLLVLCSKPAYMAAIKLVGADIIGLTGNHMLDYGIEPFLYTLDLYDKEGLPYYGGGRNDVEASRPLTITDHGNKLAFLGANSFGPEWNWADSKSPGARVYDPATMKQSITDIRPWADVILVEYQAEETYEYEPSYNNQIQFRATLADGADIVTGVQAHQPQAVEFSQDGRRIILYGLGNLFFDQMFADNVRQGLIPRHTIYEGRLLQTELLTTILEDYAQPRWATAAERERILKLVFAASGFK